MKNHDHTDQALTRAMRTISFRDPRPPQEIQFDLERDLMVLLNPAIEDSRLVMQGSLRVNGAGARVRLRFDAAEERTNGYSLWLQMSWDEMPHAVHAYHRQAAEGWFDLWTRKFTAVPAPIPVRNRTERYTAITALALRAEAHLASVEAVQQEILSAMRSGASFSTAHKEGGTVVSFQSGRFIREDYGEVQSRVEFPDESAFLDALRNLYQWETSRSFHPEQPSEYVRWKLILRMLQKQSQSHGNGAFITRRSPSRWLVWLLAIGIGGGFAWLRIRRLRIDTPPAMEMLVDKPSKFTPPPQLPAQRNPSQGP